MAGLIKKDDTCVKQGQGQDQIDTLKVAAWNVKSIALKEMELTKHLKDKNLDFADIAETKRATNGAIYVND